MNWFKRKTYPDWWDDYCNSFKTKQEQNTSLLRFVVFDTETTGLNTKTDYILSIGCIGIQNLKIQVSDQLECYLEQEHFNAETVKIHGLLKTGKLEKISEVEAVKRFLNYIKDSVLVAHHAAFDIAMINAALQRQGLPKLKNKVLDTGHLFQKTKRDTSKVHFSLDELANHFHVPLHDRHTASGDAYITALLFLKVISRLEHKGISTLKELLKSNERIGLL